MLKTVIYGMVHRREAHTNTNATRSTFQKSKPLSFTVESTSKPTVTYSKTTVHTLSLEPQGASLV